jgi:signal peptidase I
LRGKSIWWDMGQTILIAVVLALVLKTFVVESFSVLGPSMEPTLFDGDRLFVMKVPYRWTGVGPGDIVVFRYPKDPKRDFVKRVVATGGDRVEIRNGQLFVNGSPVSESYVRRPDRAEYPPLIVPEGHVFALGDNRRNSDDSRSFGPVPVRNIKGRAVLLFWPLARVRVVK